MKANIIILAIGIILLAVCELLHEIRLYHIEKKIQHYRDLFGGGR